MLGTKVIDSSCLPGVTFTPNLVWKSMRQWKMFFQLLQLRRVRRSLDLKVASYIRSSPAHRLLQLSDGGSTEEVDRQLPVVNAAACLITQMKKYNRGLSQILHDELHWLKVSELIQFNLCVHVCKCLYGISPNYLMDLCWSVSAMEGCSRLHSAVRGQLDVPRPKLSTYKRSAFSYEIVHLYGTHCPASIKTAA